MVQLDVEKVLSELSVQEKVELTAGTIVHNFFSWMMVQLLLVLHC